MEQLVEHVDVEGMGVVALLDMMTQTSSVDERVWRAVVSQMAAQRTRFDSLIDSRTSQRGELVAAHNEFEFPFPMFTLARSMYDLWLLHCARAAEAGMDPPPLLVWATETAFVVCLANNLPVPAYEAIGLLRHHALPFPRPHARSMWWDAALTRALTDSSPILPVDVLHTVAAAHHSYFAAPAWRGLWSEFVDAARVMVVRATQDTGWAQRLPAVAAWRRLRARAASR